MLRGRPLDEDDDVETAQLPSKRTTTGLNGEVEHYDIYALPSSAPLFPGASATSIALVVVSSSRGLSNLGLRFGVRGAQDAASGALAIALERDAGFFLPREPSYDACVQTWSLRMATLLTGSTAREQSCWDGSRSMHSAPLTPSSPRHRCRPSTRVPRARQRLATGSSRSHSASRWKASSPTQRLCFRISSEDSHCQSS